MDDCATTETRFETLTPLALEVAFDGGGLTSDGGIAWLAEVDSELGLCEAVSEHVPEWRRGRARHSLAALVKQRVLQVACGYEDQNDADALRSDPLLKLACGRLPETEEDLASLPSRAWRTRSMPAAATGWRRRSWSSTSGSGPRAAPRSACSWTSTRRTIRPTESKKAATTTATNASICTIRSSSSTAGRASCSRPS